MKTLAVIPSRIGSTRLPGKPLRKILGKTMIRRVYEGVAEGGGFDVIVATDSEEIVREVESFGGKAVMTSSEHRTGTDRVCEAVKACGEYDVIVNVQGDEPLIKSSDIGLLVKEFDLDEGLKVVTPVARASEEEMGDPNVVKVVTDRSGNALYFSRSPIPYQRSTGDELLKHIGVYAFRRDFLFEFNRWPQTPLERTEMLEQLRILENGYRIRTVVWETFLHGVDTQEDIFIVENYLKGADR